jgi:dolichol kinase
MLTRQEFGRQILHILIGLIAILLIYFNILSEWSIFLLIIVGILTSFLVKRVRLPFFSFFLDNFEREHQKTEFPGKGMIFFFIGVLLVLKLFSKDIALAAIMILTLGDSVSHLIGERFGQIKNIFNESGKKLLEGTLAGTLAGFLGAILFVPVTEALFGSFIAMTAEVVQIDFNENTIDDNLVVPLVAGTVMLLVRHYL